MTTAQLLDPPAKAAEISISEISISKLAGQAKSDRNRAIDFYRVVAMLLVAVGHWAAIHVALDADGELTAGNALEHAPGLAIMSWLFQVMPLFFVVGGFSSAASLDAAKGTRPQDWVINRLRRMLAPTVALATFWAVALVGGSALGFGGLVAIGVTAAAIPLWFLANYTIDTAIAPYVLPAFRRHPVAVPGAGIAVFISLEIARFAGVPILPQLNWVLGWLLFQIAGFAWRDGLLPSGRRLAAIAGGLWVAAISAVTFGPWPASMVHFPGLENSPTHPPSVALMLFGAAYSSTAIVIAPAITRWLARSPKAWAAVVAGNAVAMSVYLWHFTAAIAAAAVLHLAGWLPTADVGTVAWWLQKMPLMGLAALFLAGIVAKVMPIERNALLAPRSAFAGGPAAMFVLAAVLSTALKQWAHGSIAIAGPSIAVVLVLWHLVIKDGARFGSARLGSARLNNAS